MSNRDLQILTLWKTLSEREKEEVLKKIQARAERENKPKRQLRPIWRYVLNTVSVLWSLAVIYVLTVALLIFG